MKTLTEATRLYNEAEKAIEENVAYETPVSCAAAIRKAMAIEELLTEIHGEEKADEILELVFQNEII